MLFGGQIMLQPRLQLTERAATLFGAQGPQNFAQAVTQFVDAGGDLRRRDPGSIMVKVIGALAVLAVGMFTYTILVGLWVAQGHAEASYQLKWQLATLVVMMITFTLSISEAVGAARIIDQQAEIINTYGEIAGDKIADEVARELTARGITEDDDEVAQA